MDIYDKSTNWKHNSWIVGLLTLFCFPFGLFLVWTHPHWRRRTKWIITGIFALCVAISGIVSESEKASIAKKLAEADVQWSAGQKADAVTYYTIENCTKESQVVQADDFKLLDSQGRTFDTSSTVSTALLMTSEDKDFLLSELQPGIARQMQQGFELPDTALESEVTLIVPQKGFFSTGDARLNVRVR